MISNKMKLVFVSIFLAFSIFASELYGYNSFCKKLSTGVMACDYDSLDECLSHIHDRDEECVSRNGKPLESNKKSKIDKPLKKSKDDKLSNKSSDIDKTLTEKQAKDLNKFKFREALINILIHPTQAKPNNDTLYIMENFKIVQKINDGYLVTPNNVSRNIQFDMAFLKTTQNFESDFLLTGVVFYAGEYKYTALNGFEQGVPLLKVPDGLYLLTKHNPLAD